MATSLWIHRNKPKTRELSGAKRLLILDQGIAVFPNDVPGTPRIPLLGLKAITTNGSTTLTIDGRRREVSLYQCTINYSWRLSRRRRLMLDVQGPRYRCCDGVTRRSFLKVGRWGWGACRWPSARARPGAGTAAKDTAVILFWLAGGASHLDMYDLKPERRPPSSGASSRRSPPTSTGTQIGEHLPLQPQVMDKISVVRSVTHTNAGHGMGSHWMLTGYVPTIEINDNLNPSVGSVVAKMRGAECPQMPPYVCLPPAPQPPMPRIWAWRTTRSRPAAIRTTTASRSATSSCSDRVDLDRLKNRRRAAPGTGQLRRDIDLQGRGRGLRHASTATRIEIVTSEQGREAFDIHKEDPRLRDRYGRNTWGQSACSAAGWSKSGVTFVTVNLRRLGHARQQLQRVEDPPAARSTRACGLGRRPLRARARQTRCWSSPMASSAGPRGSTRRPAATTGRARPRSSSPAAA